MGALRDKPLLWVLCLFLVYLVLGWYLSSFNAFWSPDAGVRFAMIRNWSEQGSLVYLHYGLRDLDPGGRMHPLGGPFQLGSGYLLSLPGGRICTVYPPLYPLLSGIFYRTFGFAGLAVLPALAGAGTSLLVYDAAKRLGLRCAPLLPWLTGLATPLGLYSVVFWDLSLHTLMTAGAGCLLLRALGEAGRGGLKYAALAGGLLGLGVWFHELFIGVFAAAALALLLIRLPPKGALLAGVSLGFCFPVAAWSVCNWFLYGLPRGPHVQGPNDLTDPAYLRQMVDPARFCHKALLQLVGTDSVAALNLAFVGLTAAYLVTLYGSRRFRPWSPFWLVGLACISLLLLLRLPNAAWPQGLFVVTPLLIPALSRAVPPLGSARERPAEVPGLFYSWMVRTCLLFTLAVLLLSVSPGVDWGNRFLLVLLPLGVLVSAHAAEGVYAAAASGRGRAAAGVGLTALLAASVISQCQGFSRILRDLSYGREVALSLRSDPAPVLLTDLWWIGPELAATRGIPPVYFVRGGASAEGFVDVLRGAQAFSFLGTDQGATDLTRSVRRTGRAFVLETRESAGLRYARFTLARTP